MSSQMVLMPGNFLLRGVSRFAPKRARAKTSWKVILSSWQRLVHQRSLYDPDCDGDLLLPRSCEKPTFK